MARNWIGRLKKGTFTRKAKAAGMTPAEYQRKVLANKNKYSAETVRQANARKTLVKLRKRR